MLDKYKNHIMLHIIILIYGFTGILGKLISLDSVSIVWHRVFIASVSLFIVMLLLKRSFRVPTRSRFIQICITGLFVALHWITFFESIQLSTASFGVLCMSTTSIHVAWLEPIVMKRKFSWLELGLSGLVVIGIYFVSQDFKGDEIKALIYGLSSALFAAVFAVFNAKFAKDTRPSAITLYEMVIATLAISVFILFTQGLEAQLFAMSGMDFVWLLCLGIICTSFAFLATIEIVKYLGAFTVSLSINLEPVYTLILGILILNENKELDAKFYFGAVIIICVIFINAMLKGIVKKRKLRDQEYIKS